MRAALLVGNGGPEMIEVRSDVPVPQPGAHEVLIEVAACGINNTDINTRVGWYSRSVTGATDGRGFEEVRPDDSTWGRGALVFPRIQGADVSGRVVAAGVSVDQGLIGRRVVVDPWIRDSHHPERRELAGYLGSEHDGGFAEYCAVPAGNAHPIDTPLSDVELASFACSWSTAEHMLQRVEVEPGQSVAITGASGGCRHRPDSTGQAARGSGGGHRRRAKLEGLADLGADAVVARDDPAPLEAAVTANGGPFDVVADVVGGDHFAACLDALRRGGRYATSGAIAGPLVQLDLRTLYLNDLELYGATVFVPQVFADLVGYIERGEVPPGGRRGVPPRGHSHRAG